MKKILKHLKELIYSSKSKMWCQVCKERLRNGISESCFECQEDSRHASIRELQKNYVYVSKWKTAREKTMKRDNYMCRMCKISATKTKLLVHHKDGSGDQVSNFNANNRLSNLLTLCFSCHALLHRKLKRDAIFE